MNRWFEYEGRIRHSCKQGMDIGSQQCWKGCIWDLPARVVLLNGLDLSGTTPCDSSPGWEPMRILTAIFPTDRNQSQKSYKKTTIWISAQPVKERWNWTYYLDPNVHITQPQGISGRAKSRCNGNFWDYSRRRMLHLRSARTRSRFCNFHCTYSRRHRNHSEHALLGSIPVDGLVRSSHLFMRRLTATLLKPKINCSGTHPDFPEVCVAGFNSELGCFEEKKAHGRPVLCSGGRRSPQPCLIWQ